MVKYEIKEDSNIVLMHVYGWTTPKDRTPEFKCTATINFRDYERIKNAGNWHALKDKSKKAAYWQIRNAKGLYLSRFILKHFSKKLRVRYLDGDPLNLRRSNISVWLENEFFPCLPTLRRNANR
jgi:hypothetical protein